jgi:hypothetical protein
MDLKVKQAVICCLFFILKKEKMNNPLRVRKDNMVKI